MTWEPNKPSIVATRKNMLKPPPKAIELSRIEEYWYNRNIILWHATIDSRYAKWVNKDAGILRAWNVDAEGNPTSESATSIDLRAIFHDAHWW